MSKTNGSDPAYPLQQSRVWNAERAEYEDTEQFPGMTIRAAIAMAAMQGLLANSEGGQMVNPDGHPCKSMQEVWSAVGSHSVAYADALIAALNTGGAK